MAGIGCTQASVCQQRSAINLQERAHSLRRHLQTRTQALDLGAVQAEMPDQRVRCQRLFARHAVNRIQGDHHRHAVVVHVASRGQFFATRESARQFIAEEIDALSRREGVIIDWAGVQAVTGAFASEYAAWCLSAGRRFGNIGMNDEVRETYVTAMRRLEDRPAETEAP